MRALRRFQTATPAWIARENSDGTFSMESEASDSYDEMPFYLTRAFGSRHTDPDDACDPVVNLRLVHLTDAGWLRGIEWNLEQGRQTGRDPADGEVQTIEEHWRAYLAGMFTPSPCWCAHDCCGHRHGSASVTHLGGAVFLVEVATSRNY